MDGIQKQRSDAPHANLGRGFLSVRPSVNNTGTCGHVHDCRQEQKGLCSFVVNQQTAKASNTHVSSCGSYWKVKQLPHRNALSRTQRKPVPRNKGRLISCCFHVTFSVIEALLVVSSSNTLWVLNLVCWS